MTFRAVNRILAAAAALNIIFAICGCAAADKLNNGRGSGSADGYTSLRDDVCNIGIHLSDPGKFLSFEEKPDILGWFEKWFGESSTKKLSVCGQDHEAIPMITWEPHEAPLDSIASGKYDDYIVSYLENVRDVCPDNDVLIRFAHEMEMRPKYSFSWYEWQGQDPETYKSAWKHVVGLSREISPQVKWVWSPNHADEYSAPYYPGDDYVDYVGVTLNLTVKEYYYEPYENAGDYYEKVGRREWLEGYGKPLIISEFAYTNDDLAVREAYFKSVFDLIENNPRIKAVVFFDYDNTSARDFAFSDEPTLVRIFIDGMKRVRSSACGSGKTD